jgi:hypothetical protein
MDISLPIQRADTISVSLITDCKTEKRSLWEPALLAMRHLHKQLFACKASSYNSNNTVSSNSIQPSHNILQIKDQCTGSDTVYSYG